MSLPNSYLHTISFLFCVCMPVCLPIFLSPTPSWLSCIALDSRVSGKKKHFSLFPLLENYDDFLIQLNTFILPRKCELCSEKKIGEFAAFLSFSNISHILSIMLSISYSAQSPKRLWFTYTVQRLKLEQKLKRGKGNDNLRGNYLQSFFSNTFKPSWQVHQLCASSRFHFLCCL